MYAYFLHKKIKDVHLTSKSTLFKRLSDVQAKFLTTPCVSSSSFCPCFINHVIKFECPLIRKDGDGAMVSLYEQLLKEVIEVKVWHKLV